MTIVSRYLAFCIQSSQFTPPTILFKPDCIFDRNNLKFPLVLPKDLSDHINSYFIYNINRSGFMYGFHRIG